MAIKLKASSGSVDLTAQVIRGIDGGYYTPHVDEEGNLTWTPLRANMPAVEGTNIKGVQGDPGVYIGETPGEENLVWINPEEVISEEVATKEFVSAEIAKAQLDEKEVDLSAYALKSEIPSTVGLASEDYVAEYVGEAIADLDLSGYALKTDIPSLEGYVTQETMETYVDEVIGGIENGSY